MVTWQCVFSTQGQARSALAQCNVVLGFPSVTPTSDPSVGGSRAGVRRPVVTVTASDVMVSPDGTQWGFVFTAPWHEECVLAGVALPPLQIRSEPWEPVDDS